MKRDRVSCSVADQQCIAPANLKDEDLPSQLGECFRCGLPVCRNCSSRRKYAGKRHVRLCNNCQVDIDGDDKIVLARIWRLIP
jgi:hypothetical protein